MKPTAELVVVDSRDFRTIAGHMNHRMTMLSDKKPAGECVVSGTTVWGSATHGAVLYWSWGLTTQGMAVLSDPLGIRSNLLFSGPGGVMGFDEQLQLVNQLVYCLNWQDAVIGHIRRLGLRPQRSRRLPKPTEPREAPRQTARG